jgi:3-oxoacyl-[acyl-carrier-protein] synthase-1
VDACVVGAVDTLCTARTLEHLDRLHRLRNPQQDEEPIPGEAAAFVVLEPRSTGRATRASAACVAWAASAMEPGEKRSVPGTHLTRAVQECLHRSDTPKVTPGLILSDMGGRKQEALHLAFARIRAFPDQAYAARLVHPAESLGDVGAATGPLLMVLATLFQRAASGSQPHALLTTETREQHGAACLIAPERK